MPPVMETTFFSEQGVYLSNARLTLGHTTYPLRHITTVQPFTIEPKYQGPIFGVLGGVFLTIASLNGFSSAAIVTPLVGVLMGIAMIVISAIAARAAKATHGVFAVLISGHRIPLLATTDLYQVDRLVRGANYALLANQVPSVQVSVHTPAERTIERQTIVTHCRFCGQLTPVALSACGSCGARIN